MKKKWWWQAVMTYPIWVEICYIVTSALSTQIGTWQSKGWDHKPHGWTLLQWMIVLGLAALPSLYLGYAWYREHRLGKEDFSPDSVVPQTTEKLRAMYPDIPDKYLSKNAEGFIFGKAKDGRYIRFPLDKNNIIHCVLIGDPGSGKTSGPVLCTLIKNYATAKPPMTVFAMDLKPEIAKKSVALKGNKYVRVFDINDRDSWGFDLLYRITDKSSEDEILRVLTDYAEVLMETTNEKHAYFYENAKNIFKGAMLYAIKIKQMTFIDAINKLGCNDVSTYITDILDDPQLPNESRVRNLLNRYKEKSSESFQDIESTLQQKLDVFSDAEVMWHLRDNPLKITPTDMEQGISVYVVIPEELLEHYAVIIRVIVMLQAR